jgi:hypothetical protein
MKCRDEFDFKQKLHMYMMCSSIFSLFTIFYFEFKGCIQVVN